MGQILFAGGGGGTVGSDDLTATAKYVVQDMTYMGNDTDDDMGTGTCPDRRKNGTLGNLSSSNGSAVHKGNAVHQVTTTNNTGVVAIAPAEGYYDGNCYTAMPLADVRSAINYTDASKVVNTTTICGMTGTMANIAALDPMKSVTLSGSNLYVRMSKGAHITDASSGYPEVYGAATSFISALGVASITNFSVGQYSSQKLLFTWSQPSKGLWSGIRIVANQSRYPNNATDGTYWDSGSTSLITGTLNTGTWYIRAWNYITWSGGRYYGGYSQGSYNNATITGSKNFTYSQSWTVPTAVRQIQYFIVGGGGGSYMPNSNNHSRYSNGGGGGYTKTGYANVTPGQTLSIVVGAGGYGSGGGGTSSINGIASASGGNAGTTSTGSGSGGSGGGGAYNTSCNGPYGPDGGSDGSAGFGAYPGSGQGSSTRCPWDSVLYAGGGGGGHRFEKDCGAGGAGGGGAGGSYTPYNDKRHTANDGTANTGGGGGGIGHDGNEGGAGYTSGGSGIVRIRW